jgi:hypothetical protein
MKRLIYILLIFFITRVDISAQDMDEIVLSDTSVFQDEIKPFRKKLHTGFSVNSGYTVTSKGQGGPFLSLSPHVTYPVSQRFYLNAGISAGFGNMYMPSFITGEESQMLPMTQMFIYASGNYIVNNKLTVSGSAYKRIVDVKNPNGSVQPKTSIDNQGLSIGFNYKITENISFDAHIHFNSPSNYNSFYSPYGYTTPPYGW